MFSQHASVRNTIKNGLADLWKKSNCLDIINWNNLNIHSVKSIVCESITHWYAKPPKQVDIQFVRAETKPKARSKKTDVLFAFLIKYPKKEYILVNTGENWSYLDCTISKFWKQTGINSTLSF